MALNPQIDTEFLNKAKTVSATVAPGVDPASIITILSTVLSGIFGLCQKPSSQDLATQLKNPNLMMQASFRRQARKAALQNGFSGDVGLKAAQVGLTTCAQCSDDDMVALVEHGRASVIPEFDMM